MTPQKRMIHVLLVNDFFPELCALTLPTIEAWATKVGAKVNYISKRRWPEWPVLTEKLQVWYDGAEQDWNLLLDADVLIDPAAPDIFTHLPADHVLVRDAYHASIQLEMQDPYFLRDGRNIGISSCFVAASRWCHDLWRPLPEEMPLETALANIHSNRKCVDEYCLSRNLARYGLRMAPPVNPKTDYNLFYHLGTFGEDPQRILDEAKRWLKEKGMA